MRTSLLVFGFAGAASLFSVNSLVYMALLSLIRHRYDDDAAQRTVLGVEMAWLYRWLNIPHCGDGQATEDDGKGEKDGDSDGEMQIQDYNINADAKLARMAYGALFYPRIAAVIVLTFVVGSPLLRVMMLFK